MQTLTEASGTNQLLHRQVAQQDVPFLTRRQVVGKLLTLQNVVRVNKREKPFLAFTLKLCQHFVQGTSRTLPKVFEAANVS